MFDGYVHRYNGEDGKQRRANHRLRTKHARYFRIKPQDADDKELRPRERYLSELISPDAKTSANQHDSGQLRAEFHERLSTPLYPLVFAFIAIALLGHARTTRENRWGQIFSAFGIGVGLRVAGIVAGNLVTAQCVGRGPCVCYSGGGDSRCGLDGAR